MRELKCQLEDERLVARDIIFKKLYVRNRPI